jgi:hypothetical protein
MRAALLCLWIFIVGVLPGLAQSATPALTETPTLTAIPTDIPTITPGPSPTPTATATPLPDTLTEFLSQTYLDPYFKAFKVNYAAGWQVTPQRFYVTIVGQVGGAPILYVAFQPRIISAIAQRESDPTAILNTLADTFPFIVGEAQATFINGRPAAIAGAELDQNIAGIAFVARLSSGDYGFGAVMTARPLVSSVQPLLEALITGYDSPNSATIPSLRVPQLQQFAGEWQTSIQELEANGLISTGGSLLDAGDQFVFNGIGSQFTPLAPRRPHQDIVMGGQILFTPTQSQNYESCSLMARMVTDGAGTVTNYLEVGLDNTGTLFYFDAYGNTPGTAYEGILAQAIDLTKPVQVLVIVVDERVSVYVNGRNVADNAPVGEREGTYGVTFRSAAITTRCELRNVWVYRVDEIPAGVCQVSAALPVNKRGAPNLAATIIGEIGTEPEAAIAYALDGTGMRWYQVRDGGWVREDVVLTQGACRTLPRSAGA